MAEKIDLRKEWKHLYRPSKKEPVIVDVPSMNFLMIDGHGDPNTSQEFKDAAASLFPFAYAIKFAVKKAQGMNFSVMPLEGLWWVEDMSKFSVDDKSAWDWTLMIMQPEYVTQALIEEIRPQVAAKKNPPSLSKIRFEQYHEAQAVQIMHIGPYADEGPNIAWLHTVAKEQGYELRGKHHEIYLSDANKTAPERLKTVLRQPIQKN